jgi:uroporphyrinogen-III synthase
MPESHVNEALALGLLERTQSGDRVLLFRAQEARDVVPYTLAEAGRIVDDVAAYKTCFVDDPDLIAKTRDADVLTFTSSSTVSGFVANVHDAAHAAHGKIVACIGPITAATARDAGMRVDVIAEAFTARGLARALGPTARS